MRVTIKDKEYYVMHSDRPCENCIFATEVTCPKTADDILCCDAYSNTKDGSAYFQTTK